MVNKKEKKTEVKNVAKDTTVVKEDKKCDCGCGCGCGCDCKCGCNCKNRVVKFIIILIIFLAGMGFNELLHSGCRHNRHMSMKKMMATMPAHDKGVVVVINTDGRKGAPEVFINKNAEIHKRPAPQFKNAPIPNKVPVYKK